MPSTPQAVRQLAALLLPIAEPDWAAAADGASKALLASGIESEEDQGMWLTSEQDAWQASGTPSPQLTRVVRAALGASTNPLAEPLTQNYFSLHHKLQVAHSLDHEGASAVLADCLLIVDLARQQRMSAARIASVLAARNPGLAPDWQAVAAVLGQLGLRPSVSAEEALALYTEDVLDEGISLADADAITAVVIAGEAGERVGLDDDFERDLAILTGIDAPPFGPYLQMLHFLCTVAEYWDHDLTQAYEFSPRGDAAAEVFGLFAPVLAPAGNPFLNNAKGVTHLNRPWALSRKGNRPQAMALIRILEGLNWLGFAARREVARWVRMVLIHAIRTHSQSGTDPVAEVDQAGAESVARAIASGPTATRGILEQRLVDACGTRLYPTPTWIARGVSDPVNASNASRRKLGDCDFSRVDTHEVVALEAHAGKLTPKYVQEHVRTLERTIHERLAEWDAALGSGARWSIEIRFVAHDLSSLETDALELGGLDIDDRLVVRASATTFADIAAEAARAPGFDDAVNAFVIRPSNEARTPDAVRVRLASIAPKA